MQRDGIAILLEEGQRIVQAFEQLGLVAPLYGNLEGWQKTVVGSDSYAHRYDEALRTTSFVSEVQLQGTCSQVMALIREFDVGTLAGKLQGIRFLQQELNKDVVEYTSCLPWPYAPRKLFVDFLFGVSEAHGSIVALGRDYPETGPLQPTPLQAGEVAGHVNFSAYCITPSPNGHGSCTLRRAINVNMQLHLPEAIIMPMLLKTYKDNTAQLRHQLQGFEGSVFHQRQQERPFYACLDEWLETIDSKHPH